MRYDIRFEFICRIFSALVVYFLEMKAHFMQSSPGAMCTPDIWPASLLYQTNAVFYSGVLMHTLSKQGTYTYICGCAKILLQ